MKKEKIESEIFLLKLERSSLRESQLQLAVVIIHSRKNTTNKICTFERKDMHGRNLSIAMKMCFLSLTLFS